MADLLCFERVSFAWAEGAGDVLKDFSLRITEGEKVVLLGPNGCGKSTLLRLANGLIFPQRGAVLWRGQPVDRGSLKDRAFARAFRCSNVLLFQHPEAMLFNPTVRDEIAYGPRQLGLDDVNERVEHWANALQLLPLMEMPPFDLSGGQKQKVALACLLALNPSFMALDEPSASLDPRTVSWLIDTLLDSDKTLLISTHNLSLAAELGDRAVILNEAGQCLYDGPLAPAMSDMELLEAAGLAHRHRHVHGRVAHEHLHAHDWEPPDA